MVGRDALLIAGSMVHRYRTKREGEGFFDVESLDYKVTPSTLSKVSQSLLEQARDPFHETDGGGTLVARRVRVIPCRGRSDAAIKEGGVVSCGAGVDAGRGLVRDDAGTVAWLAEVM